MAWPMNETVVVDFETNGCDGGCLITSRYHRIVQFAAATMDGKSEFNHLVHIDEHIPAQSTAIHGISNADLAGEESFGDVWDRFEQWMPANTSMLVAHNMHGFDGKILRLELVRSGRVDRLDRFTLADSLLGARSALQADADPCLQPFSLGALYQRCTGYMFDGAHDALADVRALIKILSACPAIVPQTTCPGRCLDSELLTALRNVGVKRATRIANYLEHTELYLGDKKTVGALRSFCAHFGVIALEKMLRDDVNVFDDHAMVDIMQGVTGRSVQLTVPYFKHYGRECLSQANRDKLVRSGICTKTQLKHVYMYDCCEVTKTFTDRLRDHGIDDGGVAMCCKLVR